MSLAGGKARADFASLGVWVGPTAPAEPVTYQQWLQTGSGYWAFLYVGLPDAEVLPNHVDIGATFASPQVQQLGPSIALNLVALDLEATAHAPTVTRNLDLVAPSVSMAATPAAPAVVDSTPHSVAVDGSPAALDLTAQAPTVQKALALTASAATLDATAQAPTVARAVAIAAASVDDSMTAQAATVTTAAGGGTAVSDNFNRANGGLGANWTTQTGHSAPQISGNQIANIFAGYGARYSGATFNGNQYSSMLSGFSSGTFGAAGSNGVAVRMQSGAHTFYCLCAGDDGEGGGTSIKLWRVVAGTATQLGTTWSDPGFTHLRLEANGSILTAKWSANGTTWTTLGTATDSNITGGEPGFLGTDGGNDDWAGGDL